MKKKMSNMASKNDVKKMEKKIEKKDMMQDKKMCPVCKRHMMNGSKEHHC